MRVRVAITGTLSRPRKEIAHLIETKTNAVLTEEVNQDTDYLVASRTGTDKARAAAEAAIPVISEQQLMCYIEAGHIPPRLSYRATELRNPSEWDAFYRKVSVLLPFTPMSSMEFGESGIQWTHELKPAVRVLLDYEDFEGIRTRRVVVVERKGRSTATAKYWGAYDGSRLKTFREDRIVDFELLPNPHRRSVGAPGPQGLLSRIASFFKLT